MKTSKFAKFSASKLSTKATATITGGTDPATTTTTSERPRVGAGMVTEVMS